MLAMIRRLAQKPILLRIGILLAIVVALAVVSMVSSVFIARTTEGLAAAVNQSGTLRMQSYRVGMALADQTVEPAERAEHVARLAGEFESRLASPRLAGVIPEDSRHPVHQAYHGVRDAWTGRMRPHLVDHLAALRAGGADAGTSAAYLRDVDGFVAQVDDLVGRLEALAEGQIQRLQHIQAAALLLTVLVVTVTLVLVLSRVIAPLGELLGVADRARRGDFGGRTRFAGDDELGRVGAAMNRMGEDLSRLYRDLENRVEEKTRDLARTNHSLELLYRVGSRLNGSPISEPVLGRVLDDIDRHLQIGPVTLCLHDGPELERGRLTLTTRSTERQREACSHAGCRACQDGGDGQRFDLPLADGRQRSVVSFPVEDQGERFGVLIVDLPGGSGGSDPAAMPISPWQTRLLANLAGNLGMALRLHQRQREGRRLALHEERGILARELHDSLAQSLSYLKIQASRLSAALDAQDMAAARSVLSELRGGINSAYRSLRELLTTFRLKMDDRGLASALVTTVAEFQARGTARINLDDRLPASLLTPNEEIHVLQIIREALSNTVRHANACEVQVRLALDAGTVEVEVNDDGRGLVGGGERARHYGLAIMRERALNLGGMLTVESPPEAGTRVRLIFRHRGASEQDAPHRALAGAA
jgi:two-component system nitrate/nitrite sensor histidine kinase NarX